MFNQSSSFLTYRKFISPTHYEYEDPPYLIKVYHKISNSYFEMLPFPPKKFYPDQTGRPYPYLIFIIPDLVWEEFTGSYDFILTVPAKSDGVNEWLGQVPYLFYSIGDQWIWLQVKFEEQQNPLRWEAVISNSNRELYLAGLRNYAGRDGDPGLYGLNITATEQLACYGNIASLLDYQIVRSYTDIGGNTNYKNIPIPDYAFTGLFKGFTNLVSCPDMKSLNIGAGCYKEMFEGCTSLYQLPQLPALELPDYCYQSMFNGCTSIKLSESSSVEYSRSYKIPTTWGSSSTSVGTDSLTDMFSNTGGTFTGTLLPDTDYYTSNNVQSS